MSESASTPDREVASLTINAITPFILHHETETLRQTPTSKPIPYQVHPTFGITKPRQFFLGEWIIAIIFARETIQDLSGRDGHVCKTVGNVPTQEYDGPSVKIFLPILE